MSSTNNQQISLADAIDLTTNFQASRPFGYPICETFDLDNVNTLLSASGCASFRVYLGQKEDDSVVMVLVAVDSEGNDLLPSGENTGITATGDPVILEDGYRCPQFCPGSSPLIAS